MEGAMKIFVGPPLTFEKWGDCGGGGGFTEIIVQYRMYLILNTWDKQNRNYRSAEY